MRSVTIDSPCHTDLRCKSHGEDVKHRRCKKSRNLDPQDIWFPRQQMPGQSVPCQPSSLRTPAQFRKNMSYLALLSTLRTIKKVTAVLKDISSEKNDLSIFFLLEMEKCHQMGQMS